MCGRGFYRTMLRNMFISCILCVPTGPEKRNNVHPEKIRSPNHLCPNHTSVHLRQHPLARACHLSACPSTRASMPSNRVHVHATRFRKHENHNNVHVLESAITRASMPNPDTAQLLVHAAAQASMPKAASSLVSCIVHACENRCTHLNVALHARVHDLTCTP